MYMWILPAGRNRNRRPDDLEQLLRLTHAPLEMDGASGCRGGCHWDLFVVHLLFCRRHMRRLLTCIWIDTWSAREEVRLIEGLHRFRLS